jgi:hypothetical protein
MTLIVSIYIEEKISTVATEESVDEGEGQILFCLYEERRHLYQRYRDVS